MSKFLSLPQKNKEKPAPSPAARPRPAAFHFKTNIQYTNQETLGDAPDAVFSGAGAASTPLAEPRASAGRGAFHVQSVSLVCVVLSGVQRAGCLCSSADLMSSLLSWCSEKRADIPAEEGAAAAGASSEVMMAAEGQEFGKSLVFAAPNSQPYCHKTHTATAAFAPTTQSPPTSWPQARTRWSSPSPTSQSTPWTGNCCLATYLAPKVIMRLHHLVFTARSSPSRLKPFAVPCIPCSDFSGQVLRVGSAVTKVAAGDYVAGFGKGCAAHLCVVEDTNVVKLSGASHLKAASTAGVVTLTASECLRKAAATAGSTVVVIGASGGVGHVIVQMAKNIGACVIAVCRHACASSPCAFISRALQHLQRAVR